MDDWYISWFSYVPDQPSIPREISMSYSSEEKDYPKD